MKGQIIKISVALIISTGTLYGIENPKPQDLRTFSDNTQFENANQFYKLKKFGKAIELLKEYIEIYPNGLHRNEAFKIIGSIYFDEYDYPNAIKSYRSLYEEHDNTEEGIEAFFMTAICYQKMGFTDRAKYIFYRIIEEYPGSNFAYKSKIKLDLISITEDT